MFRIVNSARGAHSVTPSASQTTPLPRLWTQLPEASARQRSSTCSRASSDHRFLRATVLPGSHRLWVGSSHRVVVARAGRATGDGGLPEGVQLREGREEDLRTVAGAVLSEKMNPLGLRMERFVVAEESATGEVLGFGQLKVWPCLAERQDATGQLVRAAGLTPNWEGELVELGTLIVRKRWRGKGIGSALVSHLVSMAEGKNLCLITLASSVPFYEPLGFKTIPSEEVPRPLQAEVFWGTIVARLAVNDAVVCMAHVSTIERNMRKEDRWLRK